MVIGKGLKKKMNKSILMIICGIFLISFISSNIIYGGSEYIFELDVEKPIYTVVGNTSNIEGINITYNGTHIKIQTALNMKPDEFILVFFEQETKTEIKRIKSTKTRTITDYKNITEIEFITVDKIIEKEIPSESEINENETSSKTETFYRGLEIISIILLYVLVFSLIILLLLLFYLLFKSIFFNNRDERRFQEQENE